VSQLKQEMTVTRAAVRDGSEFKVLKERLTELQGKVQSLCDETVGLKSQVSLSLNLSQSLALNLSVSLSLCDEAARAADLKSQVTLVKDEAAAAKNKMKGFEEVALIKADVVSSKSALEKLQADHRAQQLKILELDGVKQQISGLKEDAGTQN
jgi:hypothetical protein